MRFVDSWTKLSGDPWVRQTVMGAEIQLDTLPIQERVPFPYRLGEGEVDAMEQEVRKLWGKGVIVQVEHVEGEFISNVFLRPKPNGEFRLILDLTEFNKHVKYEHFKMASLQTAIDMMRPGCFMGSVDLKDAYYSVQIKQSQRKWMRFVWRGRLFEFVGMPNGLSCAPRIFTKLLAPVYAALREEGVECFPYIDDSFVVADTTESCRVGLEKLSSKLDSLGLYVHEGKSVFTPDQELLFLGFLLSSKDMTVRLTEEKVAKFTRAASDLLGKQQSSVREAAGLVGLMTAYAPAVEYAQAHIKALEKEKNEALEYHKGDFRGSIRVIKGVEDIMWWLENLENPRKIRTGNPDCVIYTDASLEGWGAHRDEVETGGRWLEHERELHINVLELKAILFGLKSLCSDRETHVKIFTDNTTARAYVQHMGGVKSPQCNVVAREIWQWAEENQVWLTIAHIPGVFNTVADFKSRKFADNLEWELNDKIFQKICRVFGTPEVDLFASRTNSKLEMYASWHPDPDAWAIDAFALDWSTHFCYLFPPFSLVGRVLQKLLADQARAILVAPRWATQPWYARLNQVARRRLLFRKRRHNLKNLGKPENRAALDNCPLGAYLLWPKS